MPIKLEKPFDANDKRFDIKPDDSLSEQELMRQLPEQQIYSGYQLVQEERNNNPQGLDLQQKNIEDINNAINHGIRNIEQDPNVAIAKMYKDITNIVGYNNQPEKNIINSHPIASTLLLGLLGGGLNLAFGDNYNNTNTDNFMTGFLSGASGAGGEIAKAKQKWKEESNKQKVELAKALFDIYANHGYNNAGTISKYAISANQIADAAPKVGTQYGYQDVFRQEGMDIPVDSYGNPIQMTKDFYESETESIGSSLMKNLMQGLVFEQAQQSQNALNNNYNIYQKDNSSQTATMPIQYNGNNVNINNQPLVRKGIPVDGYYQSGGVQQNQIQPLRGIKPSDITTAYNNYADSVVASQREGAKLGETNRHNVINEKQGQQKTNSYVGRNSTLNAKTGAEIDKIKNPDKYENIKNVKPEQKEYYNEALSEFSKILSSGNQKNIAKAKATFIKRYGVDPLSKLKETKSDPTQEAIRQKILDKLNKK